jgi:Ca2+/Na+ antiporter
MPCGLFRGGLFNLVARGPRGLFSFSGQFLFATTTVMLQKNSFVSARLQIRNNSLFFMFLFYFFIFYLHKILKYEFTGEE